MSSRAEQKKQLREERLKAEQAERARATRNRRMGILGAAAVVVVAIVVGVLVLTDGGNDPVEAPPTASAALFDGIPQDGLTIGNPDAPVEVEEFVDLQCPVCKAFSEEGLETLINDYVRPGQVKLTMRPIAILGPDSQRAAEFTLAAAQQNLGWNYAETFFANQGPEGTGFATDEFLQQVAEQTRGLDVAQAIADRDAPEVPTLYNQTLQRQQELSVDGTPSFFATTNGGEPQRLDINPNDADTVGEALDPIVGAAD